MLGGQSMSIRNASANKGVIVPAANPFVLNVVAGPHAISDDTAGAIHAACETAARGTGIDWLAPERAFDIGFSGEPDAVRAALRTATQDEWLLDINIVPAEARRKRLLIADMDSTIIGCECIDELADMAGLKPKVAA